MEQNTFSILMSTGPVVRGVLIILIFSSVMSWAIIFSKWLSFKQCRKETEHFLDLFWNAKSLDSIFAETKNFSMSPVSNLFRAGYVEFQKVTAKGQETGAANAVIAGPGIENVERTLRKTFLNETLKLEKSVPYLATVASVAPFIGLFGTVWGIMNAFHGLGQGGPATLARVAPGISEALVTTAVGLAAAIPALVAYNQFVQKMRSLKAEMETFGSDFTNILKRNYLG
ncbi:MAG: protein TolQ [Bdellovibrionales bacterium]|nr:protein TolQ [Bdellovibrionales bacterium]